MKNIKKNVIPFSLGILTTIVLQIMGMLLLDLHTMIPAYLCLVLLICFVATGIFRTRKLVDFKTVNQARDFLINEREKAEHDFEEYRRRTNVGKKC